MLRRWRRTARVGLQGFLRRWGYELRRLDSLGGHPLADARTVLAAARPVVFDVGANTGQTIARVRHFMPGATIHSFEPSESTFEELRERYGDDPLINLNRVALGARREERKLFENVSSEMTSFLPLGEHGWGSVAATTLVPVETLDDYCERTGVATIDLLKLDTQGFELEVLRGGAQTLAAGRVTLLLAEVFFAAIYERVPSFCEVQQAVSEHGFVLVSMYDLHHVGQRAGWCDALFVRGTDAPWR